LAVELILAPNPGLMTGPGTNTWIVDDAGEAVIIDPGPRLQENGDAIRTRVAGLRPVAVLVTHSHPDHAPAANPLADEFGIPTIGFADGPHFIADRTVVDGDEVGIGDISLRVVATPGHTADSICFRLGDDLFTGDHVMGGSTVVVEDMGDYMASLERLVGTGLRRLYPGHGPIIDQPDEVLTTYLAHRRDRERQIVGALHAGATSVDGIVSMVYQDVDPALHPVAAVSVAAHLLALVADGRADRAVLDGYSPVPLENHS
jgi:glyoxylase-like metal-dependent hydrolase (beta-lactamase superfamily II)